MEIWLSPPLVVMGSAEFTQLAGFWWANREWMDSNKFAAGWQGWRADLMASERGRPLR